MHVDGYDSEFDDYHYELRCFKGVKKPQQNAIVDWLDENQDIVRELSFRVCARLVNLYNQEPDFWEEMALSSETF